VSNASVATRPVEVVAPTLGAQRPEWILVVPGIVALVARLSTGPHPIDDAYITFRYARNLADGLGLVYNAGEWVLGTTAPLWAVVLALGDRLGATDVPWLALIISAGCDAAAAVLLARLAVSMHWSTRAAVLVGIAWALNPMSVAFAAGGMETSAFVCVALVALTLAARGSAVSAAVIAGASTALRPEGALLALAVVAWDAYACRRLTWQPVFAALLPMLAVGGLLFAVYGSPLPHSVAAKQVAYTPVAPVENLVALLLQAGLPGFSTFLIGLLPVWLWASLALIGLASLAWLGRVGVRRLEAHRVAYQPFALFALLFVTFYVLIGLRGVRLFYWYGVPMQPLYLLAAAAGMQRFNRWWLPAVLVIWQVIAVDWRSPFLPAGENLVREQVFADLGRDLRATLPANATIAAPEIGALGYTSGLRMLDTVGLVSPAALAYYPLPPEALVTDNAIPAALITAQRPDAVVTLDAYAQHTLLEDAAFVREYQLVDRRPADVWQSRELLVFRRATP
jgi:arabinofuranosyltransferase